MSTARPEARPAWLVLLADACRATNQREVARRLDLSATTVNQVLLGKYSADTAQVEQRVLERLDPRSEWLGVLREATQRSSQAVVAMRLGIGATTISQVLSGNYKADTGRVERRARGELMGAVCDCPVMGQVSTRVCQDVQDRGRPKAGAIGNPQHAQAWHACRGTGQWLATGPCPHFNGGAKAAQAPQEDAS